MNQLIPEKTLDRATAPVILTPEKIDFRVPEKELLENGIPVHFLNIGNQEVLRLEFAFKGGTWFEAQRLNALYTARMMKEGTSHYSAAQLAENFDFLGASFKVTPGKDHLFVTLYVINKNLPKALELVNEVFFESIFPEKELQIAIANSKQRKLVNDKKADVQADRLMKQALFGNNHPYGFSPEMEDYDAVQRDHVYRHFQNFIHGGNCTILAVGKIPSGFLALMNRFFGMNSWLREPQSVSIAPPVSAEEKTFRYPIAGSVQSAINFAKPSLSKTHPDFQGFRILNLILGGYFSSRLMSNIREEKGYTYGIYSSIVSQQNAAYHYISTETGHEFTEAVLKEIRHELNLLCQEVPNEEELTLVRNYMLGNTLAGLDGISNLSSIWSGLIHFGLDGQFIQNSIETIRSITGEELRTLAQQYLQPDSFYEIVAG